MAAAEEPMWSVGLRNCDKGYLTAETFAFKLNCKSTSLKKKQTFFLEANPDGTINIKTSLGRYISAEKSGALTAEATERGPDTCLTVEAQPDGRWALKSIHGRYVGGRDEKLDAFGKTVEEDRLWVVHLAMHPQVCIKNISRKRYAHLDKDEVNCDEDVPWGADAMITMRFVDDGNAGKYELETCDGRFITEEGTLSKDNGPATRFTLQFFGGQVAFAGKSGKVLSAGGGKGGLRAKAGAPGRDEMFVIEDSQPQFKFKSFQGKFVTCSAGDQAAANQPTVTDTELFQMEIDKKTKKWSFRTAKVTFLSVAADGKVVFSKDRGANEWFDVEWLGPKVAFKASNGKYVAVKPNGSLLASAANSGEEGATYVYELVNRPTLVLRGENGFIFVNDKGQVRSNSVVPEVFKLQVTAGDCKISGKAGSWAQEADGVTGKAGSPEVFHFEFVEHSKLLIKTSGGKYLQGFQNGDFKPTGTKADASTLFEY